MEITELEIIEMAREIRKKDYLLYTWESALVEAKRIIENRVKFKEVESYYNNYMKKS